MISELASMIDRYTLECMEGVSGFFLGCFSTEYTVYLCAAIAFLLSTQIFDAIGHAVVSSEL